jgi:hypothetical protein
LADHAGHHVSNAARGEGNDNANLSDRITCLSASLIYGGKHRDDYSQRNQKGLLSGV